MQKTMRVLAAKVGWMMDFGAINQPMRHPVAANASVDRPINMWALRQNGFHTSC